MFVRMSMNDCEQRHEHKQIAFPQSKRHKMNQASMSEEKQKKPFVGIICESVAKTAGSSGDRYIQVAFVSWSVDD